MHLIFLDSNIEERLVARRARRTPMLSPCLLIGYLLELPADLLIRGFIMAKGAREKIKLKSTESKECYWTTKNKRTCTDRIELKKYDKKLKKHVIFKEAK